MAKKDKKTKETTQDSQITDSTQLNPEELLNSISQLNEKYNTIESKLAETEKIINTIKDNLLNLNIPDNLHLKLNEIDTKLENLNKEKDELYNLIDNYSKEMSILSSKIAELDNLVLKIETSKEEINSYKTYLEPLLNLKENIEKLPEIYNIINDLKEKDLLKENAINSLQNLSENLKENLQQIINEYENKINNIINKLDYLSNDYEIKTNELLQIIDNYKISLDNFNNKLNEFNSIIDTKIIDYFQNYQSKIDISQSDKLLELENNLENLYNIVNNLNNNIENFNNDLKNNKEEIINLIENKITEYVSNVQAEIDAAQTEKILELDKKIENLNNQYVNLQSLIDAIQSQKIFELEEKINNTKKEFDNILNETQHLIENKITEYVSNVQAEIDAAQTEKILELDKKIENLNNQYVNVQSLIDAIQSQKIFELEEKINNTKKEFGNILNETQHLIENKIIEYVTNVQAQIDAAQTDYIKKIEDELFNFKTQVSNTLDNNKNDIFTSLKEQLNETLLTKISEINNNLINLLNENILKILNEIKDFSNNQMTNIIDSRLNENYINLKNELINIVESHKDHTQKLIDYIQDIKITELTNKLNNIENNIENKIQNIYNQIDIKIKEEIENNLKIVIDNLGKNIEKINEVLTKKEEVEEELLETTPDLPYDIDKLIDFMNKEDINSNNLFIKPNNRPFFKIKNNLAAIGKVLLKNGDIFNFIKKLLTNKELETLVNNGIFEKFFEKNNIKYKLYTYKTVDGYVLNIRKIINAPLLNEIFLPIIDINILLNNIKNLVIFTGDLGSGKSYTLSTIINHINNTQVKKIAIISEKIEYNFVDKESIIMQFEYQNDRKLLDKFLFNILYDEFDIVWISTNLVDIELMNTIINLINSRRTVILELNYPSLFEASKNLLDLYKNKEDYKQKLLNYLNLGISQKLIYSSVLSNFVPLIEIVVLDNEIRKTILENKYNEYLQYIYKVGEAKSEIQNYNECLAYLVRNGKLDKEEAKRYFQSITVNV